MDYGMKVQILWSCSSKKGSRCSSCPAFGQGYHNCMRNAMKDAADAITALLAENARLRKELGAYKDTGLEPDEVTELMAAHGTAIGQLTEYRKLGTLDRLRELAQADAEGRLLVLPAKIGDKYYTIERFCTEEGYFAEPTMRDITDCEYCEYRCDKELRVVERMFLSTHTIMNLKDEIGKTVFLTPKEAEAALEVIRNG